MITTERVKSMVGLIIGIIVLVISIVFRGCILLVLRFNIVNSIWLSGLVLLLTKDMQWNKEIRWTVFITVLILSFIQQHIHKSMKIMMGTRSTELLMTLGDGWPSYTAN